jgi:hypothetical protein
VGETIRNISLLGGEERKMSLTFNLTKGLLNGIFVGLTFAIAIFLVATAVFGMGWLTLTPVALASLIFANGVLGGVGHEYGVWLKKSGNSALVFCLTLGLLDGIVFGLYMGIATYLVGLVVVAMGFLLAVTATDLAGLIFGIGVLMMVTYQYNEWHDKITGTKGATTGAGPPTP